MITVAHHHIPHKSLSCTLGQRVQLHAAELRCEPHPTAIKQARFRSMGVTLGS